MKFEGYERSDGSVGVRNHVLILSASNCANQLAGIISDIWIPGTITNIFRKKQTNTGEILTFIWEEMNMRQGI